ncbi:response regulator [Pseudoalteromonas piscicida]|uniref:response regulator n=1 Tax=Pseudoalteromonas piscicida TaxID=43662 RepID=UPI0030972DDC
MRNVTFLVVDDCLTVRNLVRNIIHTRLGSDKVLLANNGQHALQILDSEKVDLIISDWNMPELNGEELLYQVRNHSKLKDIPFIMMTSNGGRDFVITAIQNGVSHFVVKPFKADKLEAAVNKSWNSASKRQSVRHSALPAHQIHITTRPSLTTGQVINISHTGMQIHVPYNEKLRLFQLTQFDLVFNDNIDALPLHLIGLTGTIVRIEASDEQTQDCLLGVKFTLDAFTNTTTANLNALLTYLDEQAPDEVDNC